MYTVGLSATTISDLWFQAINEILVHGKRFTIHKGSFAGQQRIEFDYFYAQIKYPMGNPILPEINPSLGIPNPVDHEYVFGGGEYKRSYIEYLMTAEKEHNEEYTYGERLTRVPIKVTKKVKTNGTIFFEENNKVYLNQIEYIIDTYKKYGSRNNQMILQIARPRDLLLDDPPCLRHIDTRIQNGKLIFFVYFRSWDLWAGLPANLAAIQTLKEYMANEIGVEDGPMRVESKGLHIYGYAEKLAKIRCNKETWN